MTLTWPWALLAVLLLPGLLVAEGRARARRRAQLAALAEQGLVPLRPDRERRARVAPLLVLAALTLLLLALSRPVAAVAEPHREGTLVLALDVSTSMAAADGAPTRLDAAKKAALSLVDRQPADVRVGVVAFGGSAVVTQQPTTDRAAVRAAVERLTAQGDTAIGRGLVAALGAIAGRSLTGGPSSRAPSGTGGTGAAAGRQAESLDGVDIGYYGGTAVVLLTDGENTGGADPLDAADLASTAGVKVDTVGLGSARGTTVQVDGFTVATRLDEDELRRIAERTGGTYANAPDAGALDAVFDGLELRWTTRSTPHEVTSWVVAAALLLLLAGVTTSVLRTGRVL
ncbi:vWA domain-containing protein [Lapillicoccus jejuensis]|uniref:Ca-activated chloride channel family protein n=1 Tax=Lapillicoccus jejuensis TaxID=402171 RepID=A0A542DZK6_9MICO|nr:VWA domain-containing protein [Lapillicoccus jejuensis]TQJ08525.1 Ca-activated chloride channel family protein [Lapillicoccus jejuensis]